ncbi:SoxR reducing system RseC family protein [Proteiniborus sp.]|uniref:SoxR reducing system RseC family protein n=1 Tax=Proteiniborus sp. TaxID=2079015 RepID=UPI00332E023B
MEQIGFVVNVSDNMAKVVVGRTSACGENCASCGSNCNVQGVSLDVKNTLGAKAGDYVELKAHTSQILKSAIIVYLFPLFAMIVGIIWGINIFKSVGHSSYETYGFLMGLAFLGFSYIILKLVDNKIKKNNRTIIEMTRIVNK